MKKMIWKRTKAAWAVSQASVRHGGGEVQAGALHVQLVAERMKERESSLRVQSGRH